MKNGMGWMAVCIGVLMSLTASAQAPDLEKMDFVLRSVPDGPVASVNGKSISREDFAALYQNELAAYAMQTKEKVTDKVRLDAGMRSLTILVQREILHQEALKLKLAISSEEMKTRWSEEMDNLKKALPQKEQSLSEADILKKGGTTREKAEAELKRSLLIEKMKERIAQDKKVTISDAEIKQFYDENKPRFKQPQGVHLEQIYINTRNPNGAPDEKKKADAKQKMENALKRVQAGESFQAVAKAVSEAPDKERGGDMGMLPAPELPPFFLEAIAKMKPGDISGIIESSLGMHLIKLIEVKAGSDVDFEKASKFIKQRLMEQKTEQVVGQFCQPFLAKSDYVVIYLDLIKTLSANPKYKELLQTLEPPAAAAKGPAPKAQPAAKPAEAKAKAPAAKPAEAKAKAPAAKPAETKANAPAKAPAPKKK